MRVRLVSAFVIAAAGVAVAARADEEPSAAPVSIGSWDAPPGCVDPRWVESQVELLVGRIASSSPPVRARGTIGAGRPGWFRLALEVESADGAGRREIEAPTCRELADAAVLILATSVDPVRVAATRATPPAAPTQDVFAPPPARPTSVAPESSPSSTRFDLFAVASGDVGTLPSAGFGFGEGLGWSSDAFRLELGAGYWPARTASLGNASGLGGDFSLLAGSLRGCYAVLRASGFAVSPCLAFEVGRETGTGVGVDGSHEEAAVWVAPIAGALATWQWARAWALRLSVDGVVPLNRPEFAIVDEGGLFRSAPISGRIMLGVEFRL